MMTVNWVTIIFGFLGGMGILLYGIQTMREGLQKILGHKLRTLLESISQKPFLGVVVGVTITALFQSSTATTVILVGLTNAAVMTLRQSMPVILGADIGTSLTAQLIALKFTEISLLIVGLGAPLVFFSRNDRQYRLGQTLVGFGFLFFGLKIIGDTLHPLQQLPAFAKTLLYVSQFPLLAIITAALITFLIHSSAAVLGIIMVLAEQKLITLSDAIYLILGSNVGTSFTALLASSGSRREAQRVALAHLFSKLGGTVLFFPLVPRFGSMLAGLTPSVSFEVANAHAFFNLFMTAIFLPFRSWGCRFIEWVWPEKRFPELEPKFLREEVLAWPSLAIGLAHKESTRIFAGTLRMLWFLKRALQSGNPEFLDKMVRQEKIVDALCKTAVAYLTRLLRQPLSPDEHGYVMGLIRILDILEKINDVFERDVRFRIETKRNRGVHFSLSGKQELMTLVKALGEEMLISQKALIQNNACLAEEAITCHSRLMALIHEFRQNHIRRLTEEIKESEESSAFHLELLNCLQQLSEMVRDIDLIIFEELSKGVACLEQVPAKKF